MDQNSNSSNPLSPIEILRGANVGIVGGGNFCHKIVDFFQTQDLSSRKPKIIAVAEINPDAKGLRLAQQLGMFTTMDYSVLYGLDGLDVILEITHDANLAETIPAKHYKERKRQLVQRQFWRRQSSTHI